MQLEGNPSGAAYAMGPFWSADWDVDWQSLRAPDATTFRGGYVNTIASASTIVVPGNRFQEVFIVSGTTTINTMTLPTVVDTSTLEGRKYTFYAQSAGLTIADGSNLKLNGDWVSTSSESVLRLQVRGGLLYEISRSVH
jgi:hypothetical protein